MSVFDPLYEGVAHAVVGIHAALQPLFGKTNGYGWALSIVLLTMGVRLILFPLFVKQIKSQRTMQTMQPKMKEIREKYKNDRQKMNAELMALQKEHGNPLLGCLPIFAQIPLFFALFHVLNGITPKSTNGVLDFHANHGLTYDQAKTIGSAKVFGVPLAAAFRSSANVLHTLTAGNATAVKGVALVLIIVMCATTYLTQKQIQGRNGPVDPSMRAQQKMMLYLAPGMLAISGFIFPIGVLFYWLTTNLWSMGQQFFVLRRMPTVQPVLATGTARAAALQSKGEVPVTTKPVKLRKSSRPADVAPDHVAPRARLQQQVREPESAPASPSRPMGSRPNNKRGKGGKSRPGGRR